MAGLPYVSDLKSIDNLARSDLISLANGLVREYGGLEPSSLGFTHVRYRGSRSLVGNDAVVIRWDKTRLSTDKADALEQLVGDLSSPEEVWGGRKRNGKAVSPKRIRSVNFGEQKSTRGYSTGSDLYKNLGLFIGRRFYSDEHARKTLSSRKGVWLYDDDSFVELRLSLDISNLDMLEYCVRGAAILAGEPQKNAGKILAGIYRSLVRREIDEKAEANLVGMHDILEFIRWTMFSESLPIGNERKLKDRTVLLAGVPGVGKSSLVKVLATESDDSMLIPIDAINLYFELHKPKDESSSLFPHIRRLRERTGVDISLFCDDIESLVPAQEAAKNGSLVTSSSLLNKLQGVGKDGISLSGSTNNPFDIDPRFLQFGRIGYVLYIPLPGDTERLQTFNLYADRLPADNVDFSVYVSATRGFSNRDIEEVVNTANKESIKRAAQKIRKQGETLFQAARRVTQEVAKDFPITQEDARMALEVVSRQVRADEVMALDKRIREFCENYNSSIGFHSRR